LGGWKEGMGWNGLERCAEGVSSGNLHYREGAPSAVLAEWFGQPSGQREFLGWQSEGLWWSWSHDVEI